jgi:hypothetical protein
LDDAPSIPLAEVVNGHGSLGLDEKVQILRFGQGLDVVYDVRFDARTVDTSTIIELPDEPLKLNGASLCSPVPEPTVKLALLSGPGEVIGNGETNELTAHVGKCVMHAQTVDRSAEREAVPDVLAHCAPEIDAIGDKYVTHHIDRTKYVVPSHTMAM